MAIRYIPNDPRARGSAERTISPSPDRPASRCGYRMGALPEEKVYPSDAPEFVHWQCRQAALQTIEVFEAWCGPLVGWRGKKTVKRIQLSPITTSELNAYYDRGAGLLFCEADCDGTIVFTGASTDVVAHEVGHGILDALRPQLWDVTTMEVAAFHEGFGDCMALMVALADRDSRLAILKASPDLSKGNFAEAWGEEMGWGAKVLDGAGTSASGPRRARNTHKWEFPSDLPDDGPPTTLINESHSLGQLLSGCYYDIIRGIFAEGTGTERALLEAAKTATDLLAKAVASAPIVPRFFQSVGRAMLAVDAHESAGKRSAIIKEAYKKHGLEVSATTLLAPHAAIGAVPRSVGARRSAAAATMSPQARARLRGILEVDDATPISIEPVVLGGRRLAMASASRAVDLTGLAEGLSGVVAVAPQLAMVGAARGRSAVLGQVESAGVVDQEVRSYVTTLVKRGAIDFGAGGRGARRRKRGAGAVQLKSQPSVSHEIVVVDGQRQLKRRAFVCGCCR